MAMLMRRSPRSWQYAAAAALAVACSCTGNAASHAGDDPGGPGAQGWAEIDVDGSSVEALGFSDDQHAYMAVSDGSWQGLRVTADGAITWQARELDLAPYGVGFSPSLNTIVVAGSGTRAVWTSTDRGAHFAPVAWDQPGWPASVRFFDERTVLMGDATGDRVFRSSDAGQTWTLHSFTRELLPGTRRIEVQGNTAWVVGGPAYGNHDGSGATVARSSDGALTWAVTTLQDRAHLFKGGSLHAIAPVSATEAWVAGDNRQLYHTTDGMQTWTQITDIPDDFGDFGGIAIHGNTIVVAGSVVKSLGQSSQQYGYGLYRSVDGGKTFQTYDKRATGLVLDSQGVHGVAQTRTGDLFVYGYAGLLWRYSGVMLGSAER